MNKIRLKYQFETGLHVNEHIEDLIQYCLDDSDALKIYDYIIWLKEQLEK